MALLLVRMAGIESGDVAHWELAPDPSEVPRARELVREQLLEWGLLSIERTAELIVSELVTNAVRHARGGPVRLRLVRSGTLLCEVEDADHTLPSLLGAGPGVEFGRGLRVVAHLAREWGTSRTATGKTVWFELTAPTARLTRGRPAHTSRTAGEGVCARLVGAGSER